MDRLLLLLSQEGTRGPVGRTGHAHHSSRLQWKVLSSQLFVVGDELADLCMVVNPQRWYHFKSLTSLKHQNFQMTKVILSAELKLPEETKGQDIHPFPEQSFLTLKFNNMKSSCRNQTCRSQVPRLRSAGKVHWESSAPVTGPSSAHNHTART